MSTVTSVDANWLAELGSKFYSGTSLLLSRSFHPLETKGSSTPTIVREQHFSDRQRVAAKQQFTKESEAEMKLKEEFAQAQQEKEERAKAKKSAASTPKVAGVGTPVVKRTPRRFGM